MTRTTADDSGTTEPATSGTPGSPSTAAKSAGRVVSHRTPVLSGVGLFTVLIGAALPLIDFFIFNVALPTIGRDLHASEAVLELVVAGYGVAYAVLLVLGGRLGDMLGRRRLFVAGLAAFGITSLACGLAPNAWSLVGARIAQGMAASLMLPQVLATIQATTRGGAAGQGDEPVRGHRWALHGRGAGARRAPRRGRHRGH